MKLLWIPFSGIFLVQVFGAQSDPPTPPQPYDPTIQSSTAYAPTPKPIALRIVGSNVKNAKGEYLGRIENVTLNPATRQIEYALLDTGYPANSGRVVAVPWQLLNYVWDQGQVGGLPGAVQLFRLDIDKARLAEAPVVEKNRLTDLLRPEFRQQLLAFYDANSEVAQGGTGHAGGTSAGGAASMTGAATTSSDYASLPPGFYTFPGYFPGAVAIVDTNALSAITNAAAISTNSAAATSAVTNVPNGILTPTNIFSGTTNPFPGTTTPFRGATNPFPGTATPFQGATTNVLSGGTNIFPGGLPQVPGGGTNILSPPGTATSAGQAAASGQPSSAATTATTPNPAARSRFTSPWMPAQTVVIPSGSSTVSGQSSDIGAVPSSPNTVPTPAVPLQPTIPGLPSPVVPITPTLPGVAAPVVPITPTLPAAPIPVSPIMPTQPAAPIPRVAPAASSRH